MKTKNIGALLTVVFIAGACSSPFAPEGKSRREKLKEEISRAIEESKRDRAREKKEAVNYKSVSVNDLYKMEVPDYMKPTDFLNDEASLQYFNIYKNQYVIVIDEPKDEFVEVFESLGEYDPSISVIENYAEAQFNYFSEDLTFRKQSGMQPMMINGRKALRKSAVANVDGVPDPISYQFAFAEGENTLYMLMTWTTEEKARDFIDEQLYMFQSMKEIEQSK